jgi:hypothetical protein
MNISSRSAKCIPDKAFPLPLLIDASVVTAVDLNNVERFANHTTEDAPNRSLGGRRSANWRFALSPLLRFRRAPRKLPVCATSLRPAALYERLTDTHDVRASTI